MEDSKPASKGNLPKQSRADLQVIELTDPPSEDAQSVDHENTLPGRLEAFEQNGALEHETTPEDAHVLDTHFAAVYDTFLRFKDSVSNRARDRIMKFMRQDIENNVAPTEHDEEGGNTARSRNSTYDSLLFKITIILGVIFRFPLLWVFGSFMFFIFSNFKPKAVRWGVANVVLSCISVIYAANQWTRETSSIFGPSGSEHDILLNEEFVPIIHRTLTLNGEHKNLISFSAKSDYLWTLLNDFDEVDASEPDSRQERLSDSKFFVNKETVKGSAKIAKIADRVRVKGLFQIAASFQGSAERVAMKTSDNINLPVFFLPLESPLFDFGMRCLPSVPVESFGVQGVKGVFKEVVKEDGSVILVSDEDEEREKDGYKWVGVSAVSGDNSLVSQVFKFEQAHECDVVYIARGNSVISAYIRSI